MMANDDKLKAEFNCAICWEPADTAVESQCCHQLFCEKCVTCTPRGPLTKCPTCRESPLEHRPSHLARRIIGNFPAQCSNPGCDAKGLTKFSIKDHEATCNFKVFYCTAPGCEFSNFADLFLNHLVANHRETILQNSARLFEPEYDTSRRSQEGAGASREESIIYENGDGEWEDEEADDNGDFDGTSEGSSDSDASSGIRATLTNFVARLRTRLSRRGSRRT